MTYMTYDITRHDDQLPSSVTKKARFRSFLIAENEKNRSGPVRRFRSNVAAWRFLRVMVTPSRDPRHGKNNGVP